MNRLVFSTPALEVELTSPQNTYKVWSAHLPSHTMKGTKSTRFITIITIWLMRTVWVGEPGFNVWPHSFLGQVTEPFCPSVFSSVQWDGEIRSVTWITALSPYNSWYYYSVVCGAKEKVHCNFHQCCAPSQLRPSCNQDYTGLFTYQKKRH